MALTDVPSRQTLDDVPARVFKFLIGYAESIPARAALASKGFTANEHAYAWSRLKKLGEIPGGATLDEQVRLAVVELDNWDGPNFDGISNTLLREFPAQAEFVFQNLQAADGPKAVLGVETLLDRLDILESGVGREATHAADLAALELLAKRGYTKEERNRLRGLVELAKTVTDATPVNDVDRHQILVELYRWHSEWSAHARNAVKSRATLIRLGLAQRRSSKVAAEGSDDGAGGAATGGTTA